MLTLPPRAARRRCLAVAALLLAAAPGATAQPPAEPQAEGEAAKAVAKTPLIPREVLSGNPDKAAAKISPDGKFLSYLADRKSTRLNSSHVKISYAVFCLKKK